MDNVNNLTFDEEVRNVIGCMEYLNKRMKDFLKENPTDSLSEDECVVEDVDKALEFVYRLPEIISSACVLAVYAGEDWATREKGYGFGADSYEYCDKYTQGAIELADIYGTIDFYNDFYEYFTNNIKPV